MVHLPRRALAAPSSLLTAASALLVCLATSARLAGAHSTQPAPLRPSALDHPAAITVRLVPRSDSSHSKRAREGEVLWDDSFLLSFDAHGDTVRLSLRPAAHLVHPDGAKLTETHTNEDGTRSTIARRLARSEVRAYEGRVLQDWEAGDLAGWEAGERAGVVRDDGGHWARITLAEDALPAADGTNWDHLRFQGAYSHQGQTHTIHSAEHYRRTRRALDPDLPQLDRRDGAQADTVIIRSGLTLTSPDEQPAWGSTSSCSHDSLLFNVDPKHAVYRDGGVSVWELGRFGLPEARGFAELGAVGRGVRIKRQNDISGGGNASSNFIGTIGSTAGCPKSQKVAFVGVAADCTYVSTYGSADAARTQLLTDFNSASSLYQSSFNVSLGIVELNVQSGACPTSQAAVDPSNEWNVGCEEGGAPGVDLNERLSIFSRWRGNKGGADGAGLWHLLTNCSTGSEVGVAWLGQLCNVDASTGSDGQVTSGTAVTSITRSSWEVIAHEIGHNFGAIHDCGTGCTTSQNCCPLTASSCDSSANYIMSAVSSKNVSSFSPCSIGNICSTLSGSVNTSCLATPGLASNPTLISLQSCGNGILEAGEECDPGSGNSTCCTSECKFAAGAVCDPANSECCTPTCQLATQGTVCRGKVDDQCDIEEVCTGTNATCPADAFVKDGTACGSNGLACASGVCTSRAAQCESSGSSLSLTRDCPRSSSQGCSVSCLDPSNSAACVVLQQSFRDGTPCGYGGTCASGVCRSGSALDTAKSWYKDNLRISIPVTIAAALVFFALLWCLFSCCCRRRRAGAAAPSVRFVPVAVASDRLGRRRQPPPPPIQQQYQQPVYYGNQQQPQQTWYGGEQVQQPEVAHSETGRRRPPPPPPPRRHEHWVDPAIYNGPNYRG